MPVRRAKLPSCFCFHFSIISLSLLRLIGTPVYVDRTEYYLKEADMRKRNFSKMKIHEVMPLLGTRTILKWMLNAPPHSPSDILTGVLGRLQRFDTMRTEPAKLLLVDALLAETVFAYTLLKVWKGQALESATLTGFADYLITPDYAYMDALLLCAAEAKKDDFDQGQAQCLAELVACREKNLAAGYDIDLFGFVSNGQTWGFYKLTKTNDIYETSEYNVESLLRLLGALDYICAECAKRVP